MTTLEEVFLHLGEEVEEENDETKKDSNQLTSVGDKIISRQFSIGSEAGENRPGPSKGQTNGPGPSNGQTNGSGPSNGRTTGKGGAPELTKDKNTSGYSFEPVETRKSQWQMFKALVYLRTIMKFREPAMFFEQIVMPIIYICIGTFVSNLSSPPADKNNQAL